MKLSLILASRNDSWESCEGNTPLTRLTRSLRWALNLLGENEIVLCDWGSEYPLSQALPRDVVGNDRLRIAYVPPDRCRRAGGNFNEVCALNHCVRLAKGDWVGHSDMDTLIGRRFFDWLPLAAQEQFYWCGRRNMSEGQIEPADNDYIDCRDDHPNYWKASTGIMLTTRELWCRVRGMDERMVHRNHMHHDLVHRMQKSSKLVSIGSLLDYPFWHIWHPRNGHNSRQNNALPSQEYIAGLPEVVNGPDWGLADLLGE